MVSRSSKQLSKRLSALFSPRQGRLEDVAEGEVDAPQVLLEPGVVVFASQPSCLFQRSQRGPAAMKISEPLEKELLPLAKGIFVCFLSHLEAQSSRLRPGGLGRPRHVDVPGVRSPSRPRVEVPPRSVAPASPAAQL